MKSMRLTALPLVAALLAQAAPVLAQSFDGKARGKKLDLPVTKPPADRAGSMKACPEFGAGFYRLAGSDTCVRLGGGVGVDIGTSGVRR
jgi:Porin subfamily